MFTYKILKRDHDKTVANYRLVHLQGSQTLVVTVRGMVAFDSLIHLQDSQTTNWYLSPSCEFDSLIHLQGSQTPNYKNRILTEFNIWTYAVSLI